MGIPVLMTAPRKRPIVTYSLVLINVVVFIIMYIDPSILLPGAKTIYDVQRSYALTPIAIVRGEHLWCLFTSMFIHADIPHLLGNMLFLFFFGGPVENAMGRRNYLIFYFTAGLAATMFHIMSISLIPQEYLLTKTLLNPWVTPALGASGAISGVMGAYLIYYPRTRITMIYPVFIIPLIFTLPAWAYVLIWFLYQLFMGLVSLIGVVSSIAYWAHIGGFITGVALAPIFMDPWIKNRIKIAKRFYRMLRMISDYYYDEEFY